MRKITISETQEQFESEGFEIVNKEEYKDSHSKLVVKCPEGHLYETSRHTFLSGKRCPECNGGTRLTLKKVQDIFKEKGYTILEGTYENAHIKMSVQCDNCGGKIKMSLVGLTNGCCCGCKNRSILKYDDVSSYVESFNFKLLSSSYENNRSTLQIECPSGHKFSASYSNFKLGSRCPVCSRLFSKSEKELLDSLIKGLPDLKFVPNDRTQIKPKELDIYFPDNKLAVEYCGLHWHSIKSLMNYRGLTETEARKYHRTKMDLCKTEGIRLITIFEDEWINHKDVCVSRIKNALGISEVRVYARNCEIKRICHLDANSFYDRTHLQRGTKQKVAFGLFHKGTLIQVMSLGNLSRNNSSTSNILELKRLSSLPGHTVVGGASKLFKTCVEYAKDHNYSIIRSYCDLRWGTGNLYEKLGFKKVSETKYTPHYVKGQIRYRNQNLRKTPEERLTGKPEKTLREEQGYTLIYDCGHQTWDYHIS
jgi:predicted N-acetyltransferase YhbS